MKYHFKFGRGKKLSSIGRERYISIVGEEDVANELGVSKGHAYKVIRQLNEELEKSGFIVVTGKIPRAFWEKKFYGYQTA